MCIDVRKRVPQSPAEGLRSWDGLWRDLELNAQLSSIVTGKFILLQREEVTLSKHARMLLCWRHLVIIQGRALLRRSDEFLAKLEN